MCLLRLYPLDKFFLVTSKHLIITDSTDLFYFKPAAYLCPLGKAGAAKPYVALTAHPLAHKESAGVTQHCWGEHVLPSPSNQFTAAQAMGELRACLGSQPVSKSLAFWEASHSCVRMWRGILLQLGVVLPSLEEELTLLKACFATEFYFYCS